MPIFHFSQDPNIDRFVPRPPLGHPENEAGVWAIDEWHSPLYFVPSDCPRVTFWPVSGTTMQDRERLWPDDGVRMVIAIEHVWWERFLTTSIYRYEMPEDSFEPCGGDYGAYFSRESVVPLAVIEVGPSWRAMAAHAVDFRVMPSLRAFAHRLMDTSFHWSLIRMRNSLDWDLPAGLPSLPAKP